MAYISGNAQLCEEVCKALGFSEVTSLRLEIAAFDAVRVTVEKYVTVDELKGIAHVLARYDIKASPIEPQKEPL